MHGADQARDLLVGDDALMERNDLCGDPLCPPADHEAQRLGTAIALDGHVGGATIRRHARLAHRPHHLQALGQVGRGAECPRQVERSGEIPPPRHGLDDRERRRVQGAELLS
jgi:hypothetical protein